MTERLPLACKSPRRASFGLAASLAVLLLVTAAPAARADTLITNGGFEAGLSGWRPLWARSAGAGLLSLESTNAHSGAKAVRIQHSGSNDWSLEPLGRLAVTPGELYELEAFVHLQGAGWATLCASTWAGPQSNLDWSYGERTLRATKEWTRLRSRFVIPQGVSLLQPRLIGSGPATIWVDDFSLTKQPGPETLRPAGLAGELVLSNAALVVTLNTTNATLSVLERRTGRLWRQQAAEPAVALTGARSHGLQLDLELVHLASAQPLSARLQLDPALAEFSFSVNGAGELESPLAFPYPFTSQPADYLVVPMNEGISFPVEDSSIEPMRLVAYGGHGICMAFWGVTDGTQGHAVLIETPDDAALRIGRLEGRLVIAPEWEAQRGQFGYKRQLRYVFFERGGHVAIAKRYRQLARETGLLKTLSEKRRSNPNVDLLLGAVNVWNWDSEPVELVKEMQAAGIERILWSRGGSPAALRGLNERHVLTSRYDIYQDVMDPANFPNLKWKHSDWTTAAWPDGLVRLADGQWLKGWAVEGKHDDWYSCGVLCDREAPAYARERIGAELATHDYRCRFIDTTTAAPWHECYEPRHPMTRTQSRQWKMKLLQSISEDFHLVTGSETGHDAAVPFVHYFEGMLSLGPYRVPDSGRNTQRIWQEAPERVVKFQLGQAYRLPLWELVYHDCVVAQWYWGDYNNKLPALWAKRDLFNVLYGTPPMFMCDTKLWHAQKERFVQSYTNTCPWVRAVGYAEMTDHRFLSAERNVQQTTFANGVRITVNFGQTPFRLPSGQTLQGMAYCVSEKN